MGSGCPDHKDKRQQRSEVACQVDFVIEPKTHGFTFICPLQASLSKLPSRSQPRKRQRVDYDQVIFIEVSGRVIM